MRSIRPAVRYAYSDLVFSALVARMEMRSSEPTCYKEAISSHDNTKWQQVMDDEMASLKANETWKLVPKLEKQKLVKCKWFFKLKEGISPSEPLRYKARLVTKGFTQREGIYYIEIFSLVVKFKTIHKMLAIVVHFDLELE